MKPPKTSVEAARKLAVEVAQKMNLNLSETRACVEAVAISPARAARAYKAILKSYNCPACKRPD